jgi:thioredoxin-like negative regulator of GroEL
VRSVAERVAGKAAVVKINTQDNPTLAARFAVRGIPVMMLLRGGRMVDKLAGTQTAEAILTWFHRHS